MTHGRVCVQSFDARGGRIVTAQATVEHPAEIVTLDGPLTHVTTVAARVGEVRRADDRRHRRDRRLDHAPGGLRAPAAGTRCCSTSTAVRSRSTARRSSTRPRCRPRPASSSLMSQPARRQRARHRVGSGDQRRPSTRRRPGTGWGSVDVDDVLAVLDAALDRYPFCDRDRVGMLGGSYGGYMATLLAGRHGDRFRAICSERAVNNLTSRGVEQRHRHRVPRRPRADAPRRPRRVRAHVADPRRPRHRRPDADPALGERPALPDRPGRGAVHRPAPARQGRDVLPLPRRGPRAVALGLAAAPADARRDHPRLLHREAGAAPQATRHRRRRGAGAATPRRARR